MSYTVPYLISFLIGYFLISLTFSLTHGNQRSRTLPNSPPLYLHFFLAAGLGLSMSANIVFYILVFVDRINKNFSIQFNLLLLFLLVLAQFYFCRKNKNPFWKLAGWDLQKSAAIFLIVLLLIPLWKYAQLFQPFGGWDAWQVWNFKAKFLTLGEDHWKNMFSPLLWRSSPHYPLLLPLINVWAWLFLDQPLDIVPLITASLFTFLTGGLLFSSLSSLTKNYHAIFATLLIFTLPFWALLATSQYSDIVLAYYLLASMICWLEGSRQNSPAYLFLSGLFLGSLSFTKSEGTIAVTVIFLLAIFYTFFNKAKTYDHKLKLFFSFLVGSAINGLPTLLFEWLYAPMNQTFINGLISTSHPASLERFKVIMVFFLVEIINKKWNGLWILLMAGIFLSKGKGFNKTLIIFPLFLGTYLMIVLVYYFLNTYFEIFWWLQNTLARILFGILPVVIFWVFVSLEWEDKKSRSNEGE